jgi:hypothetical protein
MGRLLPARWFPPFILIIRGHGFVSGRPGPSQQGLSTVISIFEQFFTKSGALAFLRDYRKQFPGKTFGTNIRLGFDRLEQCWKVTGHRFA